MGKREITTVKIPNDDLKHRKIYRLNHWGKKFIVLYLNSELIGIIFKFLFPPS